MSIKYIVRCERIYIAVVDADSKMEAIEKVTGFRQLFEDFNDIFKLQDESYDAEKEEQ